MSYWLPEPIDTGVKSLKMKDVGIAPCQKLLKKALRGVRVCNNVLQLPRKRDVGSGLQKIISILSFAYSHIVTSTEKVSHAARKRRLNYLVVSPSDSYDGSIYIKVSSTIENKAD